MRPDYQARPRMANFQAPYPRILCKLFRQTDVAYHARDTRDDFRTFDSPDSVDGAVRFHRPCVHVDILQCVG